MSVWSVAAAQSGSRPGDIDWNISRHLEFIHQAAEHHVNVLIFPELSLTGYELTLAQQLAMHINDARLEPFAEAASRHQMTIVIGLPLLDDTRPLLCALAVLPDATRLAYGKRNLFGDENLFSNPAQGYRFLVIDNIILRWRSVQTFVLKSMQGTPPNAVPTFMPQASSPAKKAMSKCAISLHAGQRSTRWRC